MGMGRGENATIPHQTLQEIGGNLSDEVLKDPSRKYFIPYGKGGDLAVYLYDRLSQFHSHDHIMGNQIYILENSINMSTLLRDRFGFRNIYKTDYLNPTSKKLPVFNMQFDVILTNPPYKNGLHTKIFNRCVEQLKDGGTLICIHPSTTFISRKPVRGKNEDDVANKIVSDYKTRLTLVNGNKLFDANFFSPLSITHLTKVKDAKVEVVFSHIDPTNKEVKIYESLDDIFVHGNDIVTKIRDKVFSKMDKSLEDYNSRKGYHAKWYLKLTDIVGNKPKNGKVNPDFFCMITQSDEINFNKLLSNDFGEGNNIGFSTKQSAKNGFEYVKTKFARFCVSFYKINQNLHRGELIAVPYMDFSQEWTDEKLYKYFKLSKEEVQFIESYIGDWYEADSKRKPL